MSAYHRPLDLRRAVLGHLLTSAAPVGVAAIVQALTGTFGDTVDRKRVSDVLRYQMRLGRVRRVERGVYAAVPGAIPQSTAWRCVNWRREQRRWQEGSQHPERTRCTRRGRSIPWSSVTGVILSVAARAPVATWLAVPPPSPLWRRMSIPHVHRRWRFHSLDSETAVASPPARTARAACVAGPMAAALGPMPQPTDRWRTPFTLLRNRRM